MKRFLIILAILTIAASASAAPPPFAIINPAQDSRIGTLTNTKWCYSDGSQVLCTQDAPAGAGDFLANGTVPMTGAIIPDSAGGQTIGTTSAEFGHIYLHNSKSIYFQADQSLYLTGAAGALSLTGGNFTPGASTLTLGSTAAEWGGLYLGDGKIIYGQADQSNTITSSATGWVFNLPITTQSAKLTGGTNTFNITNGTASLDVAAGAALNIDTSLQVATGAVVLNGNAGGSSSLTLGNFALSLGGTMTDGRLCTYASSGTAISCNTATSTFQTADADLTAIAALTATRGDLMYVNSGGAWADLAIGAAGTVLQTNGADPSWALISADNLTNNTITATQLAAALTFADGDFIDLSAITMSGTNDEGITLPFWADVTPTSGATKRFMTWDESGSVLKIYTASGWTTINPSAGAPTDVAYLVTGSLSGSLSAERLLAEGTGIDFTDAGANGNFTIAVDTTEIGTTTWGAGSEVVWTFNASGGTDPTITFGDATVTFAGTVSATAFSGNITGNVTGNCSGSAGTVTDTELAAIQGLTFADASIIQLTGAGAAAVLTSGGNNYVLKSTSDNSALEFAAPTGTGAPVLGTAPSFTTSITPNSAGASTIGTTALEWGNVYLTDSAVIYGQADQSATLTSSASTWTASAFTVTGTLTANGNAVVGNANTDTLTVQSTIKGSGRAVTIDDDGTTSPTYATGTQELFVAGDIESGGTVYAANFQTTGTGESYLSMANNASRSPTASAYELYFEGGTDLKININGSEKTAARLEDAQTFTGAKTFSDTVTLNRGATGAGQLVIAEDSDDGTNTVTITAQAMAASYTLTLPTTDGDSGQFLQTNGSGSLTWAAPTAAAAGSDTQVQFNDGGSALGGDAGFVFAKTTGTLTLGKNTVGGELVLYNELGATDYNATIQPNAAQAADATITLPAATGTLLSTAAAVTPAQGGTGVANGANNTITFTGNYTLGLTLTGNTAVTLPTSGTLATLGANTFTGTQALGANNLTMTGSLAATGARVTKGWFTDIESTNMPTVGGTAILSSLTAPVFSTSIEAPFIVLGSAATAADAGTIRMPNAGSIQFEADAAGTDINALSVDSSEIVQIGSAGASGVTITPDTTITGGDLILVSATAGARLTGGNGLLTIKGEGDGTDEDLTINLNSSNVATVSSSTGVTKLDFSALNLATTGTISGAIPSVSDADGRSISAAEAYGYMHWATGAGTWNLPAAVAGMSLCIYSTTAAAIVINPDDADVIVLDGVADTAGHQIANGTGTAGDFICFIAIDGTNWHSMGKRGTWTAGS